METPHKKILEYYYQGFKDELSQILKSGINEDILYHAYNLGRLDAYVGDESDSNDERPDEEILIDIMKSYNKNN